MTSILSQMLELASQFRDGSGARLLHFVTLWLMDEFGGSSPSGHHPSRSRAGGGRVSPAPPSKARDSGRPGVAGWDTSADGGGGPLAPLVHNREVCALLHRHRDVLCPALVSHLRDQMVALVMLSDDLCIVGEIRHGDD